MVIKAKFSTKKTSLINIEFGLFNKIGELLNKRYYGKKIVIVTDEISGKLFGHKLKKHIINAGNSCNLIQIKSGEDKKTLQTIETLTRELVAKKVGKNDILVGLGGGVIGDLVGFLASIYFRGINCINVPTTLMAMIDSSIGGKTGVNTYSGKNTLGSIYQPSEVFIDPDLLKTLPKNHIQSGLAEVIKYGVIKNKKLFNFLDKNMDKILNLAPKELEYIISESIKTKLSLVQKDVMETKDIRIKLNYGHTFGHAIEKMNKYKLPHGFAVSIGMALANKIGKKQGIVSEELDKNIKKVLLKCGLPIHTMTPPKLKDILSDKKRDGNHIKIILPEKIGKSTIYKMPCDKELKW